MLRRSHLYLTSRPTNWTIQRIDITSEEKTKYMNIEVVYLHIFILRKYLKIEKEFQLKHSTGLWNSEFSSHSDLSDGY